MTRWDKKGRRRRQNWEWVGKRGQWMDVRLAAPSSLEAWLAFCQAKYRRPAKRRRRTMPGLYREHRIKAAARIMAEIGW